MISLKTVWLAFLVLGSCVATGIYVQIEDIPQIVQTVQEAIPDEVLVPVPEALDPPEKPEGLPDPIPEEPPEDVPPDDRPELEEIEYPEGGYDPPGGMAT